MIEEVLTAKLAAICPRTYPVTAPKTAHAPFIVYTRVSTPRLRDFDGPIGMAMPLFQVDIYANDFDEARLLATSVRTSLDGFETGALSSCVLENEQDMSDLTSDPALSRVMLEFRLTHTE